MAMKILGVGLSRTGTSSLQAALEILGFRCRHYDIKRLHDVLDGSNPCPDFRRYDDIDALVDLPTAYFYDELTVAYPDCKCILTIRNIDDWWRSISRHFNQHYKLPLPEFIYFRARLKRHAMRLFSLHHADPIYDYNFFVTQLRNYVYGSSTPHEYLYRKKYTEHNERVVRKIPFDRLLIMDIPGGDGWEKLCPFLGVAIPPIRFPHENRQPS
jgi:hypothetical protein